MCHFCGNCEKLECKLTSVFASSGRGLLVLLIFLQNFSERQILWRMCLVVFLALTLKLPIQTSLSVAPTLPVSLSSAEN